MEQDTASKHSIELVAPLNCKIAENPRWHPQEQALFFLDIPEGIVYIYRPLTDTCRILTRTRVSGGFTLQDDGSLLLFQDGCISVAKLDGSLSELASNACDGNERFNDVIADPEGRVFAGAMGGNGRLLRFDLDGGATELFDGLGIPNGMGFTPNLSGMYFTDSSCRRIYHCDYDRKTGSLSNRRVFVEIQPAVGFPDGMTVDKEGFVWTAIWFGGRLQRYSPDGRLDREVFFPVKQTSAVAFGGPDLNEIYVTSAATDIADSLSPPGYDVSAERGGGLYRLRLSGISGTHSFRSRVRFPRCTAPES
jgi:D-xylonolactonase